MTIFMILSISSLETSVVLDSKIFFWIAASATDATAINHKGSKILLANDLSTFFIKGKPAVISGLTKLRNPPFWLLFFLVVPFNKIPPSSKEPITFIIYSISLSVKIISKPSLVVNFLFNSLFYY